MSVISLGEVLELCLLLCWPRRREVAPAEDEVKYKGKDNLHV